MKRTTLLLAIALATAAGPVAAVKGSGSSALPRLPAHETVIEKNQAFPLVGPLVVEECLDTTCTKTRG